MKKILLFTAAVFLSSYSVFAQKRCQDCVRAVYQEIFAKNLSVIKFGGKEYQTASLCLGHSKNQIYAAIDSAKIYSYGDLMDTIVAINLKSQILSFMVWVEQSAPCEVVDIYDSNGVNILYRNDYLLLAGIINDPDGYVNIRKEKSANSPIVGKIKRNQIFFYTPSAKSNWYRLYVITTEDGDSKFRGYIHKSKILPYEKCPRKIRRHMEKLLFC